MTTRHKKNNNNNNTTTTTTTSSSFTTTHPHNLAPDHPTTSCSSSSSWVVSPPPSFSFADGDDYDKSFSFFSSCPTSLLHIPNVSHRGISLPKVLASTISKNQHFIFHRSLPPPVVLPKNKKISCRSPNNNISTKHLFFFNYIQKIYFFATRKNTTSKTNNIPPNTSSSSIFQPLPKYISKAVRGPLFLRALRGPGAGDDIAHTIAGRTNLSYYHPLEPRRTTAWLVPRVVWISLGIIGLSVTGSFGLKWFKFSDDEETKLLKLYNRLLREERNTKHGLQTTVWSDGFWDQVREGINKQFIRNTNPDQQDHQDQQQNND